FLTHLSLMSSLIFLFNAPTPTAIYTLSLHDALPIYIPKDFVSKIILVDDVSQDKTVDVARSLGLSVVIHIQNRGYGGNQKTCYIDRKSTRLNSSHVSISYAVFCLKKKKKKLHISQIH